MDEQLSNTKTLGISFVSGNIAPFRAYIASSTFAQERTMHLSILGAFQGLGMTVGPAIQSMLTPLKCSPSNEEAFPYFSFDMFSSAGLVNYSNFNLMS